MRLRIILLLTVTLSGCSKFQTNHSGDPKTCRERATYKLAATYPDPANLERAVVVACGETPLINLPPFVTKPSPTTTSVVVAVGPPPVPSTIPPGTP